MIKSGSILILFNLLTTFSLAQSQLDKQFDYAKELYNKEHYYSAITEFKRLLFFSKGNEYNFESNYFIGESYKYGAKYSDAILYFTKAELSADTEEKIYRAKLQIIRTNILRKTTSRAQKLIDSLESSNELTKDEINYWRGWAFIFSDDWENAVLSFSKIDSCKELVNLCEQVQQEKYSVGFAKTISYIIPGAGQIYTGEYVSGLLSFGWNVLWGYLTINAFVESRIFDGIVVGSLLWMRFYRGNLQNAEQFAIEKNILISNKALLYLQNEYTGLKP